MHPIYLGLSLLCVSANPPAVQTQAGGLLKQAPEAALIDVHSDTPPPLPTVPTSSHSSADGDQPATMTGQIARTLLGLLVVLGIIYLVAKLGLTRLTALRTGMSGELLKVVERLQVDPKNALVLIEVEGNERLLLASNEHGVKVLSSLSPQHSSAASASSNSQFKSLVDTAQWRDVNSKPVAPLTQKAGDDQ